MAQQENQLHRESISCSICLDLLKDPVTVPCGHSYCMICINTHWDGEDVKRVYSCPQCRRTFRRRPVLGKNTVLAVLVEELKKTRLQPAPADHCYAGPEDVACDVCTGRKLRAAKSCLQCLSSYCEEHLLSHFVVSLFKKHKLVDPSENLQENVCFCHDKVTEMVYQTGQQPISYLCSVDEEKGLDTASAVEERTESEVRNAQEEVLRERWTKVTETNVPQPEPKTRADVIKYSRHITLDPKTANKHLLLSHGNRKATRTNQEQSYFSHPERFTDLNQVLSKEGLTGRSYWEVECRGEGVCVAVAYKDISREGRSDKTLFGYNDKSWGLYCFNNRYTFWHNNVRTPITGPESSILGVYLDHSAGILSFYGISETMTLLHRVQTRFTQPLHAGLYVTDKAKLCKLK